MNASWGKRALITGGSSGIGLSTGYLLARAVEEGRAAEDGRRVLEATGSAPPKELTSP